MARILHLSTLAPAAPATDYGTLRRKPPILTPHSERRPREYLTEREVDLLMATARKRARGWLGHRDATLLLIAYRHGLRVSELVALRWDQVDMDQGLLHVRRAKRGAPSTHPIRGPEIRALRRLLRETPVPCPYVFTTETRSGASGPMTTAGVRKLVARIGQAASFTFPVHPHMLRHGCGFKLANDGQDTRAIQHYLGHRNIQHTVRYTELSPGRFKDFWQD